MKTRINKFMVMLIITLAYQSIITSSFAGIPLKMSYQAVIRDANNHLVTNQSVGIRVSILQGSLPGTVVYKEIYNPNPKTDINGLVTIEIGGGIPLTGTFASIDWSKVPYFIKTETDPAGGTNYTITGTSELLSVPYAFYAKSAAAHYIGEQYGGGTVFYVYDGGMHGLIADSADFDSSKVWTMSAYYNIGSNAVRDGIIGGHSNTERIIIQAGAGSYAAQLCANLRGSYADWYLPSIYELNKLYLQKNVVGFFTHNSYWSSTEYNNGYAWYQNFANGSQAYGVKNTAFGVRAIRAF